MNILSNIGTTLKQVFPDVPVGTELQDDGSFLTPSFLVTQLETPFTPKMNNEQVRTYSFDVKYFVSLYDRPNTKLNEAAELLMSQVKFLLDDNLKPVAKVENSSTNIVDKVLHFQFSITLRIQDDTAGQAFNTGDLNYTGGIKSNETN